MEPNPPSSVQSVYRSHADLKTFFWNTWPSSTILIPPSSVQSVYRSHADLNTFFWNTWPSSTILLQNLCQVFLLYQDSRFKISCIEAPCKLSLEIDVDLVE